MIRALLLALLLSFVVAPAAQAGVILGDGDAAELAQTLAEAYEDQDVCYGWDVDVDDASGGPSGEDIGSNFGPGEPLDNHQQDCQNAVLLTGSVSFTCDSCESEDSSAWSVSSTFSGLGAQDLKDLGFGGDALEKNDNDARLASMVGALPLIVASKSLAPAIQAEPVQTSTIPATDHATGSPILPDWLRDRWLALSALLLLALGGGIWLSYTLQEEARQKLARERRARRAKAVAPATTAPAPPQEPSDG